MAEYWEILGLGDAPSELEAVNTAYYARHKALSAAEDRAGLRALRRAYELAVSVLSFDAEVEPAQDMDDGLTLDDFAPEPAPQPNMKPPKAKTSKSKGSKRPSTDEQPPFEKRLSPFEEGLSDYARKAFKQTFGDDVFERGLGDGIFGGGPFEGQTVETRTTHINGRKTSERRWTTQTIDGKVTRRETVKRTPPDEGLPEDYDGWYESEPAPVKQEKPSRSFYASGYDKAKDTKRAKITLGDAMASFYKRGYIQEGRSPRSEYWYMMFINALVQGGFVTYVMKAQDTESTGWDVLVFLGWILFCFTHIIPLINVTVRRLHDLGHSGVWYAGYLVVFTILSLHSIGVNSVWPWLGVTAPWMLLMAWPGTKGANKYGPDPREAGL
ncbi:MAG: DUF805 domain-containing protein [Maricaulaceae bacterium]